MPSETYRLVLWHECASPITHMARTEGNEAVIAREPVVTAKGVRWVPVLSGNALRHRTIREPGARWLIGEYGLAGKLTLQRLHFLFHGGALTEGGGRENTARIADMQRLLPLLRLVGGCLPDQILHGSLLCGRATLVCEENRRKLELVLGDALPADLLRPAESFISGYQYTRGDAVQSVRDLLPPSVDGEAVADSNLMIFAGQAVTRGAAFVQELVLPNVSRIELGALLLSLSLWQSAGGTIGGQSARGHGGLASSVMSGVDDGLAATVAEYIDHARASREDAMAWLDAAFAKRAEKTPKGGGKKGKTVSAADAPALPGTGD